jgi:hypothetical protein
MIKYPAAIDTIVELPYVVDNVTPIGADLLNNLRDAIVAVEAELGVKPSGIYANVRSRLNALELNITNLIAGGGAVFGGDLLSTTPLTQQVVGLQGRSIASTEPDDGYVLVWSSSNNQWEPAEGGSGGGTPGGSDTQVQINDAGVFGGDAGFTYNKTTNLLSLSDAVAIGGGTTAVAGFIRVKNGTAGLLTKRDAAGTGDKTIIGIGTGDDLYVGSNAAANQSFDYVNLYAGASVAAVVAGAQKLVMSGNTNDFIALGGQPASAGYIRLANNSSIQGRNSLNTGNLSIVELNASNNIVIGDTNVATLYVKPNTIIHDNNTKLNVTEVIREVSTSNSTPTNIYTWTITDEAITTVDALVSGITDTATRSGVYKRLASFRRNEGEVYQVASMVHDDFTDEVSQDWDVTVDHDGYGIGRIRVTGAAATDINWGLSAKIQVVLSNNLSSFLEVLSITPNVGNPDGGTYVTIEVTDSTGVTGAAIDGVSLTGFSVLDDTHVGGFIGAHAAGATALDVTVTNADGTEILPESFTYAYESWAWETRTAEADWLARDGAMLSYYNDKWWMLGGWNPYDTNWAAFPEHTVNEVWSSTDLTTWTEELAHDESPPTSGPGARWKRRHWFGCLKHEHAGTEYLYVLGGDSKIEDHAEFNTAPSNGYPSDVWRTTTPGGDWERVCESNNASWAGRMLTVFGSSPGKLWAFGGQNGLLGELAGACEVHNDLHCSTDGGFTWTEILADAAPSSTRPSPRGMINQMPYWQGRLWLVSGGTTETAAEANREYFREVWSIDPENTGAGWTKHTNPPFLGVDYTHVELFRGEMWLLGGYSGDGFVAGGSSGENIRNIWSTADGETWRKHETPPWVHTHAAGTAVNDTTLAFVAGNGDLTTAPVPPGVSAAYALVATPYYTETTLPTPRGIWKVSDAVLSGSDIVSIPDSGGGGGPDMVYANALGDATYNATDPDFGGAPSAESNGGFFLKTASAIDLSDFTIFVAGKFERSAGAFYTVYALASGQYLYEYGIQSSSTNLDRVDRQFEISRSGVLTTASIATSLYDNDQLAHIYTLHYDGTAAGSNYRIDGAIEVPKDAPVTGNAGTAAWSAILHILSDTTGTGAKAGKIAEVRVYPALTLAQIQKVEEDLRESYPYAPVP